MALVQIGHDVVAGRKMLGDDQVRVLFGVLEHCGDFAVGEVLEHLT
jgi:hypothetical protein